MLGKLLWSLFEGAVDLPEPASVAGFRLPARSPVFPRFNKTPTGLTDIITKCTAGADEWDGIRQPFVIHNGKIYARDLATGEMSASTAAIQESARSWWKFEIERAKRYFRIKRSGSEIPLSASDGALVCSIAKRPNLETVLQAIEDVLEKESG
jgi:hypothetical protein